jgi:diguanylate cyclase (GGDEF)-like protein
MPTPSEFTVPELKSFLADMSSRYDLARVVDPIECRILKFRDDGRVTMDESCYGIWNAGQKCVNCSSALACRTGCHQRKAERFQDQIFHIESNPVSLRLPDGSTASAVVELVTVETDSALPANDREAENRDFAAARHQARHDSLTGVLNAEAFYELARDLIRNRPEPSWVMVTANIMNFRLVNTLFGVARGNEVLVRTAAALREIAEAAGGLCGRLGGDQYALLLPGARYREQALTDSARNLAETFNSGIFTFCIHFGVYRVEDASVPVSVMCGRANSALRTIREDLTRTVAVYNDEIHRRLLQEQTVISGFEEALQDGQFQMYLQPLVRADGSVIGAEALARWCRPDGSVVPPGDFIETLENAGLIQRLDTYIWELAVRRLAAWKGTPRETLSVSVNMSAKDFYSIDVYEVLTGLVNRYGVDSRLLRLEITETALLVEPEKSDAVVSRLRRRGFLVEIDDFGKGFSSLSLLKNIQADVLKIDMSFLREIRDRERSRIILRSVISLAEALGMDVISEGVETEQQLRALSDMGCTHFQGYLFSPPIPVEEFEEKYRG